MSSIKGENVAATDFSDIASGRRLALVHPGEVLTKEFIEPRGITATALPKPWVCCSGE